jgi:hypothetical protein
MDDIPQMDFFVRNGHKGVRKGRGLAPVNFLEKRP